MYAVKLLDLIFRRIVFAHEILFKPNALSSAAVVGGRLRRTVRPEGQKGGRPNLKTGAAQEKVLRHGSCATLQE